MERSNYAAVVPFLKELYLQTISANRVAILEEAANNNAEYQYNIAIMYANEIIKAEHNDREALKWFKKAAKQGNVDAENALGNIYYYGNRMKSNLSKALQWYRKTIKQCNTWCELTKVIASNKKDNLSRKNL